MFLMYHPSSWGWWYIWAASVFKEFMRKEWSDFKSIEVEDLRTSHATLSASYVAGMIGMGRAHHVHKEPGFLNEKIHPWMLTFRFTYPTPWCWMSVSTTSVLASTFPRVHVFCFFGNFRVKLCTCSSGARYFKQHQCATCTMNPQVVQLCASLINRLRIEVRAASESKLMLGGKKRERLK